jgi:glutamyl-tRNA synthetase
MAKGPENKEIRVRFAPSPTGLFHLGSGRTALFNWIYARKLGGKFILRIEDTDKERSKPEFEKGIYDSLRWLGLDWDEGPDVGGEFGPYRQSERLHIYREYLEKLIKENWAYYCYCTKEELEAEREAMAAQGLPPKYSGHCRHLTEVPAGKTPQLIRFKTPDMKVEFKDIIRGTVVFDSSLFGDLALAKDLDTPLYNFAVVIDDELMKVTHVIRGEDHISNTPKQILFQKALGFKELTYAHLPLILAADRSKLSKRYAETSLFEYEKQGYLPEAMVNFLILLGWHPKDDKEIFTIPELIESFELERVQKAGAVFNEDKLLWINGEHIKIADAQKVAAFLEKRSEELYGKKFSFDFVKIFELGKGRAKTLNELVDVSDFFFSLPEYVWGLLSWKEESPEATKEKLLLGKTALVNILDDAWNYAEIYKVINELAERHGKGQVFWPLRVALTGLKASPEPIAVLEILKKEESIKRIDHAINKIP